MGLTQLGLLLSPIKELEIRRDGMVLRMQHHKESYYRWADIKQAMLFIKQVDRGYGISVKKRLILEVPDKIYKFDFTDDPRVSYFKDSDILLDELNKHLAIQTIKK